MKETATKDVDPLILSRGKHLSSSSEPPGMKARQEVALEVSGVFRIFYTALTLPFIA